MTQKNITVPLPEPVAAFYDTEAKARTRRTKKYWSRAAVMREVLERHISTQLKCQTQSESKPATSR